MKLTELQFEILNRISADSVISHKFDNYEVDDMYSWMCDQPWLIDQYEYFGQFTEMLLKLGIDPLMYVSKIWCSMYYGIDMLKSIEIPARIEEIWPDAFMGCKYLTSVTFAEFSKLQSIDESAFRGCKSLKRITIPNSVTYIGEYAFYDCIELHEIGYAVTIAQFKHVYLDSYMDMSWLEDSNIEVIHCIDGDLLAKNL